MINEIYFADFINQQKDTEKMRETIIDRANEILLLISNHFKIGFSRTCLMEIEEERIIIQRSEYYGPWIVLQTKVCDYNYSLPTKFLFMNDNEILQTIEEEIKEKNDICKKEKEEKQKLIDQALAKLTPEDRKVLKL